MTLELQHAKNVFGNFSEDSKKRLLRYYKKQTEPNWEDCAHIVIGGTTMTTVWQAVCRVDPTFPRKGRSTDSRGRTVRKWERIPDKKLFERAVRYGSR